MSTALCYPNISVINSVWIPMPDMSGFSTSTTADLPPRNPNMGVEEALEVAVRLLIESIRHASHCVESNQSDVLDLYTVCEKNDRSRYQI
jgi:hypothetical protein